MKFQPGPDGCEFLDRYQPGGFHPVEIGDYFNGDRYVIINKLGAGAYATVWLARDNDTDTNIALKVCTADSSNFSDELKVHQHLKAKNAESGRQSHAVSLLDSFWHEGPNGCHQCLVTELGGPSLASIRNEKKIRPDKVRDLARQLVEGLQELHNAGIVYGDLSPANVLFRPAGIQSWTLEEVYERLGYPEPVEVFPMREDTIMDEHVPKYVYEAIDTTQMELELIEEPEVMLIDFGAAYIVDDEDKCQDFANNLAYASPETVIFNERATQASDIWALACIIYEMRSGEMLLSEGMGQPGVVQNEMISLIGALPQAWLDKLFERAKAQGMAVIDEDEDESLVAEEPKADPTIADRFGNAWNWAASRFRNAWNWAVSFFKRAGDANDKGDAQEHPLTTRVTNIGKWNKWCYMTRKQRIATFKKFNKSSGGSEETPWQAIDMSSPPPSRLSPWETEDLTDLLSSMLRFLPEERPSLEEIEDHPYFWRMYLANFDVEAPWLERFQWGLQLWRYQNGRKITYC